MSLYDLATSSSQTSEPVLIIKHSAQAADDDPQNIAVLSNSSSLTSVIVSPSPLSANDDAGATPPTVAPPVTVNVQGNQQVTSALTKIARFIPTETVTIYLGAVSAAAAITEEGSAPSRLMTILLNKVTVYWVTALLITPAIFLLIWAIERTKIKKPLWSEFPYWKLSAAVLAFLIWALAVPGNPYATTNVAKVAIAFAAILVSIILDLIDQLFEAQKSKAAAATV